MKLGCVSTRNKNSMEVGVVSVGEWETKSSDLYKWNIKYRIRGQGFDVLELGFSLSQSLRNKTGS